MTPEGSYPSRSPRSFFGAIASTSLTQAVLVAAAFASGVVYARLLGPEGRGELALFQNAGGFLTLAFGFGLTSSVSYAVSSGSSSAKGALARIRWAYGMTVVAVPIAIVVAAHLGLRSLLPTSIDIGPLVALLTGYFAFSQLSGLLTGVLIGMRSFGGLNVVTAGVASLGLAAFVGLGLLTAGAVSVIGAIAVIVVVEGVRVLALGTYTTRRSWFGHSSRGFETPRRSVKIWRYSAYAALGDLLQFLNYRLDVWFLAAFWGPAVVGVYVLSVSLAELIWIVPGATGRVLFPEAASGSPRAMRWLAIQFMGLSLAVSAVLGLLGWGLSLVVTVPLFGAPFAQAPLLLGILLLGVVPFSVAKVIGTFLAGVDAIGLNALSAAASLPIVIVLNVLLVPVNGAVGAAIASAASYAIQTCILLVFFMRVSNRAPNANRSQ